MTDCFYTRARIFVEGKVDYGEYMDKNNVRRQATTIIAGKQGRRRAGVLSAALAGLSVPELSALQGSHQRALGFSLYVCSGCLHLFIPRVSLYTHVFNSGGTLRIKLRCSFQYMLLSLGRI